jgi:hypothetical protein
MPRINRILADENVATAGILSKATALEFSSPAALVNVDEGIKSIAQGTMSAARFFALKEQRKAAEKNASWVSSEQAKLRDLVVDFQSDPENYSSEDYAERVKAFGTNQTKLSLQKAPSQRAAAGLKQSMESYLSGKYAEASGVEERTRLDNLKEGFIGDISVALGTYRKGLSVPNSNPLTELTDSVQNTKDAIEETFGQVAPKQATRLRAFADAEFALGIAGQYPKAAENIINTSTDLTEEEKYTLRNKIKVKSDAFDVTQLLQFKSAVEDMRSQATAGKRVGLIPIERYKEVYPTENSALAAKAEDDAFFKAWEDSHKLTDKLVDKRDTVVSGHLNQLNDKLIDGTKHDRDVLDNAADILDKKMKQQRGDAVGFLLQNNEGIKELSNIVALAATPQERATALMALSDRLVELQGFPNRGESADGSMGPIQYSQDKEDQFLHHATGEIELLPKDTAVNLVGFLNEAQPSEFGKKMQELMVSYPRPEHQQIVFNDLVRKGLRQSYQLVWQNRDEWWIGSLVTALQGTKGLENITEETKGKFKEAVRAHPTWLAFQGSMIGPNQDRIEDISGFLDAITTFAMYHDMQPGTDMKDAVDRALDLGISSSMAFSQVNGQPVVFNAKRPDGTKYQPNEISDIGRRLGVSLQWLDVRKVNQDPFLFLNQLSPNKQDVNRLQKLRDHITQTGHWVTENDGETMSLYVKDDLGFSLQVRDELDKPFAINLQDLPDFIYDTKSTGLWDEDQLVFDLPTTMKEKPRKRYPIVEKENYYYLLGPGTSLMESLQKGPLGLLTDPPRPITLFPSYTRSITNFPTQPPWMQNPNEPGPVPPLDLKLKTKLPDLDKLSD